MRRKMIEAIKEHAKGHIEKHKMNVEVYLTNPVGVGEHPQHFEEMDKLVEAMTSARDKLEVLNEEYPDAIHLAE